MASAPDMGVPASFSARRPNAPNLHNFELPPPPLAGLQNKLHACPGLTSTQVGPTANTLTSVGNLLTPPSNSSSEGLSPTSGVTPSSHGTGPSFTPTGNGMWPPPNTGSTPFAFQTNQSQQSFSQGRALFSPSLNSIVRGNHSPAASESLPPPPYELSNYATSSMSMSMPNLPAVQTQQQLVRSGLLGQPSVTSASPVHQQDAFARPPLTPTYFNVSQPSSISYTTGPAPSQSPVSAGGTMKMSPLGGSGPMPSLQSQFNRPSYSYPLPGPVISNVNNPTGLPQIYNSLPPGMVSGLNSGTAAAQLHIYNHQQLQTNPHIERPFRCDQCPQSFNRNHDLKRHKRIHLAIKPFPCGHCDKSFSRKDALKRHILVKGCGKAQGTTDVKELERSSSPESKSFPNSPVITASA